MRSAPPWAERLYKHALALQPGAARPHNSYGVLLSLSVRLDEADRGLRTAMQLDPLSMQIHSNLVLNLYRQHRHREAVELARKAAALDTLASRSNGQLLDQHLALRGHILARSGDTASARAALRELETRAASRFVPRSALADVLIALGEHRRALDLMESAIGTREVLLAGLLVSPHARSSARRSALRAPHAGDRPSLRRVSG